jgi:tetratricopeptide (TPR) repeat protein
MVRGGEIPYWQAVAANLLDMWAEEPEVRGALMEAAGHTNALVRANAVHSLAPLAARDPGVRTVIRGRLEDDVRQVRYEAAWALRGEVDPNSRAGLELGIALDHNADFPSGQMQKGMFELSRGHPERALKHYETAVAWDTNSAALRHELAVVLSMVNRTADAVRHMEAAVRLAPAEAEYRYKLGLVLHETGRMDESILAMERAVELDPQHARAWYNLGLARHQAGRSEAALFALAQGENANPADPEIPYARATILMQLERIGEARAAAARALDIQPGHGSAAALIRSLR